MVSNCGLTLVYKQLWSDPGFEARERVSGAGKSRNSVAWSFLQGMTMKRLLPPFGALLACTLLMLAGCQDKHEPVKPTVAAPALVR
jgi:hypothetical protein